jgi:hypothetical protein
METIYHGNNVKPTGVYNNGNGRVTSYVDTSLIDPQAVNTAGIRKQAQEGVKGDRAQKARLVEMNFKRLLEQAEHCDDFGRNA